MPVVFKKTLKMIHLPHEYRLSQNEVVEKRVKQHVSSVLTVLAVAWHYRITW
jgi:hypothetical protein